jgi:type II secretory ATPase GspE/PulE/Tfp pilus assembly ATPase PilB-like protein
MDDDLRELVLTKTSSDSIRKMAIEKGMTLMYDDAMEKVRLGRTTIEEALNVTQVD